MLHDTCVKVIAEGRTKKSPRRLHRREISQIECADLVAEWGRIVEERKGAQVGHLKPPGSGPGSTGGTSEAARKLGMSHDQVSRSL